MPLIRYRDKIIFFVHIPKTGGTSIEDTMAQAGAKVALRYGSRFHGFMKSTFQHLNADIHNVILPSDFYDYAFAMTRHPVSRLISEYYYRIERGDRRRNFDRWVNRTFDQYHRNPYLFDNHIRPQSHFLRPDIETFRIEGEIENALNTAADHLGIHTPLAVIKSNQSKIKEPVTVHRATLHRIWDFYKVDFEAFEYDPEQNFPDISVSLPRKWGIRI